MPNLWPQQLLSRDFLRDRRRAYLADVPGWPGKTPPAIVAATELGVARPLVLCPASAREMWRRMWGTWGSSYATPNVMSYDELVRHPRDIHDADLLILDEAHRCRNVTARRTQLAMRLANTAPIVWALSGTPMVRNCGDFYPLLRAVWPDYLRALGINDHEEYMTYFSVRAPTEHGYRVMSNRNVPVLRELIGRIMLRRASYDGMPPLTWENYYLDGVWPDEVDSTSTTRRLVGAAKAPIVAAMIADELESGAYEKIVVGYHHVDAGDAIVRVLNEAGFPVYRVDGATSPKIRQYHIDQFQEGAGRVFLGQMEACGEAITLNAATEIAIVEPAWSDEVDFQFVKRVHRGTQDRPCRARLFYAPTPLEEAVERVQSRKLTQRKEVLLNGGI